MIFIELESDGTRINDTITEQSKKNTIFLMGENKSSPLLHAKSEKKVSHPKKHILSLKIPD